MLYLHVINIFVYHIAPTHINNPVVPIVNLRPWFPSHAVPAGAVFAQVVSYRFNYNIHTIHYIYIPPAIFYAFSTTNMIFHVLQRCIMRSVKCRHHISFTVRSADVCRVVGVWGTDIIFGVTAVAEYTFIGQYGLVTYYVIPCTNIRWVSD